MYNQHDSWLVCLFHYCFTLCQKTMTKWIKMGSWLSCKKWSGSTCQHFIFLAARWHKIRHHFTSIPIATSSRKTPYLWIVLSHSISLTHCKYLCIVSSITFIETTLNVWWSSDIQQSHTWWSRNFRTLLKHG